MLGEVPGARPPGPSRSAHGSSIKRPSALRRNTTIAFGSCCDASRTATPITANSSAQAIM
jgi:hypothetical protein